MYLRGLGETETTSPTVTADSAETTPTVPVGTIDSGGSYNPETQTYTSESGVTFRIPNYSGILGGTSIKGGTGFDFGALSDPTKEVKPIPVVTDELRTELNTTWLNPQGFDTWTPAEQDLYREGMTAMNEQIYQNVQSGIAQWQASQPTPQVPGSSPVYGGGASVPAAGQTPASALASAPSLLRQWATMFATPREGARAPGIRASRLQAGAQEAKAVPGEVNTVSNVSRTVRALATPENIQGVAGRVVGALLLSKVMGAL